MTDHTQAVADALAHFGSETRAAGCTVDDITHGLALAREVRRLTALVTAQEIDITECDAEDAAIIDRARALCHQYDITVDASVEGYTSAALRGMDAEVSRLTAEVERLRLSTSEEDMTTRKDSMKKKAERYVIVRTYSAGVFAGVFQSRTGQEVVLTKARRLWYWKGAASLSQLATDGTNRPTECKFPAAVTRVELLQAIEILDCTAAARASIEAVNPWQA